MYYQWVQSVCYLLLTWFSQQNATNTVEQCDILWERQMVKIPVNKVMTQLESYYVLEVKLYRYNSGLANRKQIASGGFCEQIWRKNHLLDQ